MVEIRPLNLPDLPKTSKTSKNRGKAKILETKLFRKKN